MDHLTAGKTHLCHLLCVVLLSQYQAIYIDTEGTFRIGKLQSIAKARGLDPTNILQNIQSPNQKTVNSKSHVSKKPCSSVKYLIKNQN